MSYADRLTVYSILACQAAKQSMSFKKSVCFVSAVSEDAAAVEIVKCRSGRSLCIASAGLPKGYKHQHALGKQQSHICLI